MPLALKREPSAIAPETDGSNPFNFPRLVQPVLNRSCVECHNKNPKAPVLTAAEVGEKHWARPWHWSQAYASLQPFAFYFGDGTFTASKTVPGRFGALASPLYSLLIKGDHHGVKLSPEDLHRLTLWLDCNSDFFGTYEHLEAQVRGESVWPVLE